MDKNEILVPILTAINDLREEVRENRRAIQRNSEAIQRNSEKIDSNSKQIISNGKAILALERRMEKHEEESRKDRRAILDILYSYEQVTDNQYKENKKRIEKLEEKFKIISA